MIFQVPRGAADGFSSLQTGMKGIYPARASSTVIPVFTRLLACSCIGDYRHDVNRLCLSAVATQYPGQHMGQTRTLKAFDSGRRMPPITVTHGQTEKHVDRALQLQGPAVSVGNESCVIVS